jgi:hypothetical protein
VTDTASYTMDALLEARREQHERNRAVIDTYPGDSDVARFISYYAHQCGGPDPRI